MDFSTIFTIILYALLAWFLYTRFGPVKGLNTVSAEEFKEKMSQRGKVVLIDVRQPDEYKSGYIAPAINIPVGQIQSRLNEINKNKEVLLYCKSGMRSKLAAKILKKNGYTNLVQLRRGVTGWRWALKHK
ncbi:rhodanese-like domain-containing protein [Brevibacillus daliensis]|uniref:rhodanese-like domain-containing protein n=1 Tax=Brevibacillus daliensis TaxID=2892995 RepID=UPI001E4D8961|nr:rhodanese-like domain-containing protein [Brevibacillus daliensis]